MTSPPNPPDGNDENPYGGQSPYGGPPHPAGGEYGAPAVGPKTDGVSIASLVTGVLCCTGPIAVILGIIGIVRTKDGRRKGRWAAVTGTVLGALGVVAIIGLVVGGVWIFNNTIRPDNAEVGQCGNVQSGDDSTVVLLKKDCSEDHDAEIVGVEVVTADNREQIASRMVDYCSEVLSDEDQAAIDEFGGLELKAGIENPDNVTTGDHLVCYVEATEGKIDEKVLG